MGSTGVVQSGRKDGLGFAPFGLKAARLRADGDGGNEDASLLYPARTRPAQVLKLYLISADECPECRPLLLLLLAVGKANLADS